MVASHAVSLVDATAASGSPARAAVPRLRRRARRRVACARAALRGGVDVVQLRDKDARDDEELARRGARVPRARCERRRAVHPQRPARPRRGAPAPTACTSARTTCRSRGARAIVGPDALVGRSTHAPEQVDAAGRRRTSTTSRVGPVHATPTKPGRPAVGLELVALRGRARRACRGSRSAASTPATIGAVVDARRDARRRRAGDRRGRRSRGGRARAARARCEEARWGSVAASAAGQRRRAPPRARVRGRRPKPASRAPSSATPTIARAAGAARARRAAARRHGRRGRRRVVLGAANLVPALAGLTRRHARAGRRRSLLVCWCCCRRAWGMWTRALLGRARLPGRCWRSSIVFVVAVAAASRRTCSAASLCARRDRRRAAGCSGSWSASWRASRCPSARPQERPPLASATVRRHGRELLRLHRHRLRARRLRRRDPRRAARHEDGRGREGHGRRALPELRLHPGQGRAALADMLSEIDEAGEFGIDGRTGRRSTSARSASAARRSSRR